MSASTGNKLRVGKVTVGLFGLEKAVAEVRAEAKENGLGPEEAAEKILALLEKRNYVPDEARKGYLKALVRLWKEDSEESRAERPLSIRILGPGCVSCNQLEEIVREILNQEGIAADIDHVHDHDEIWRYEVMQTPALVIDEKVLCAGRLPSRARVEAWIRNALDK